MQPIGRAVAHWHCSPRRCGRQMLQAADQSQLRCEACGRAVASRRDLFAPNTNEVRANPVGRTPVVSAVCLCWSCRADTHSGCCDLQGSLGTFVNPHGHVHQTVTMSRVRHVHHHGVPSCESSWFPGYAWTMAHCAVCMSHLGWRFDLVVNDHMAEGVTDEVLLAAAAAVQRAWPPRFWGLRGGSTRWDRPPGR